MDLTHTFQELGIALGLGLLVGLQRERTASLLAGFRTFPLVTTFGVLAALLSQQFGGWILAAGFVALTGIIVIGNVVSLKQGERDPGITTEVAMLLMFAVGAYIVVGSREVAVAVGAGVAVLLQFKERLHGIASRLEDRDVFAVMQFALVSLVILPALPDRTFGPYDVLNPHQIWLMVVLIVGISLGGYVAYKLFGEGAGTALGGILGGLISSTATTVTYARRAAQHPNGTAIASVIILIASTTVFGRLLLELAVAAPSQFRATAGPIAVMLATMIILSAGAWLYGRDPNDRMPEHDNPSELKPAIAFGLLYGVVLFAVAAAKENFGTSGLYVVAALSGLTDVDAITLSSARLVSTGSMSTADGWRVVLVAACSNLAFKAGTVAVLGTWKLFRVVGTLFAVAMAVAAIVFVVWRD